MSGIIDVVIIGAGLSGLQSALDLHEAGLSVIIVEARNRIGGKTCSVQRGDGKGIQEAGAAWLNNTSQSLIWSYCQKFGLKTVVQNIEGLVASEDEDGRCHMFPFGELPKFSKSEINEIIILRDAVEAASLDPNTFQQPKRGELDGITFEQYCRDLVAGSKALMTARVWCRGTLGQDPNEVSALAYLEVCRGAHGLIKLRHDGRDGAQHLRLVEGTQSISTCMAKLLPTETIRLNTSVKSIVQHSTKIYTVFTSSGENVKARKVILSIPGPTYKNIEFKPKLPIHKQTYTTVARYGCYIKYVCMFKSPFWRQQGSCGLAQSFRGPLNHCRDTSVDEKENYALTCFLCAGPGRKWMAQNKNDRQKSILKQLSSLFGVSYQLVQAEYLSSITSEWMDDQWAGWGCPFAAPPPGATVGGDDGSKITDKFDGMYFVGTELTDEWRGYMEGALRSGKRGAAQAISDLNAESSRI